ncbi:major capsid protein [Paenibacillus larvae]|uniref:major capsid protein n=1 Tax=Paenibacillus larvae TaxID=1464 RepID=UPI0022832894|nr:major capsid protein [Paenibacillus larvae]MCY9511875.1 major capsid protein [Paenibacillus larvae]MCY9526609.1 major capsid protein [Paenibacillus larvae]
MPSIYDLRTLISAVRQIPPANTFLGDTLFTESTPFDTEQVEVEFQKGKRKMAPFVSPLLPGKVMDRQGYTTSFFKPALIKPMRAITSIDLNKKLFGQNPFETSSPEERAQELLARDLVELDDYITRREEWMRAQLLFTGKVIQKGDGVDQVLDFDFDNKAVLSGNAVWSNNASDPLGDLGKWRLQVIQKSGITPDVVIMSSDVATAFISNEKVQKALENRRINLANIDPKQLANGVTYHGTITSLGLELYSYDDWYLDDETDEELPMVPTGTLAIASTRAKFSMHYGAVTIVSKEEEFSTIRGSRVPQSWVTKEPAQRFLQVSSRPLPIPGNSDSWFVAKVL